MHTKIEEYTNINGEQSVSISIHVNDMNYEGGNFPPDIRKKAAAASGILQDAFTLLDEEQRIERDLVAGARIDPRKRHKIGVAMRRGNIDANELRPYYRRSVQSSVPTIAIVASAGLSEAVADYTYLERITTLSLGISWACEAVDVPTHTVLLENHEREKINANQPYREAMLAYTLVEPGKFTAFNKYAVALNAHQLYKYGYGTAFQDPEALTIKERLSGKIKLVKRRKMYYQTINGVRKRRYRTITEKIYEPSIFPSRDGGPGIHWARSTLNAQLIIGIGDLTDLDQADIQLPATFDVIEAVREIAKQARIK